MQNKFFNYFLSSYNNSEMEVQKKAAALLIGDFIIMLGLFASIPTLYLNGITIESIIGSIVQLSGVVTIFISLILLKRNNYKLASYLVSNASIIVVGCLMYFTTAKDVFEFSKIVAAFLVGLTLTSLISKNKNQVVSFFIGVLAALTIICILKIITNQWVFDSLAIREIVQGFIFIIMCSIFTIFTLSIMDERVKLSQLEALKDKERYKKIEELLASSKVGINIGESLVTSTNNTLIQIEEINKNIINIKTGAFELNSSISLTKKSNDTILNAVIEVNTSLEEYRTSINQSSSAIEEMTSSINNISNTAKSKKDAVNKLASTTRKGEDEMNNAVKSINEIAKQANAIMEVIDVIVNVASQTDLLAMNASIEAAHAGDAGKGFAVVADEIRKLAEQTNDNIKIITDTLKKTIDGIQNSSVINQNAAESFHQINKEVFSVESSLEEVIIGMQELSSGTNEVMQGVSNIVKMSSNINNSTKQIESMINHCNIEVENITNKSNEISNKISVVTESFSKIINESKTIKEIGVKNIHHVENLDLKVQQIQEEEKST